MPEFITFLAITWGVAITLAWLLLGWRAVIAHESISASLQELLRRGAARPERDA